MQHISTTKERVLLRLGKNSKRHRAAQTRNLALKQKQKYFFWWVIYPLRG